MAALAYENNENPTNRSTAFVCVAVASVDERVELLVALLRNSYNADGLMSLSPSFHGKIKFETHFIENDSNKV